MKERLNIRLYNTKTKKYESTEKGLPQGGIDSLYLWNIYLLSFDKFMQTDIKKILDDSNQKRLRSKKDPGKILTKSPVNPL